jgi:release factor glutamine methyltransferase
MTLFEALTAARQKINRLDARLLLQHATGCSHSDLLARPETPVATAAGQQFMAWVERRAAGEPLAYLVGEAEFRGRVYQVSPAVLIPRPETEVLIDLALEKLRGLAAPRVLDLGTGSGIVAISLALECPAAQVVAVDLSPSAILVARDNASRLGAAIDFRVGDWFAPVAGERFDLVVANPPYVAAGDPHLEADGLPFEPRLALTGQVAGGDGLACIRAIVAGAPAHLDPGGWLLFEHGHDQGQACRNLLTAAGFQPPSTLPDLAGIDRVSGAFVQPEQQHMSEIQERIHATVTGNPVVLYMKGDARFPQCGFSAAVVQILKHCGVTDFVTVNVLADEEIRQGIKEYANWPTIPQLYINGEFIGGCDIVKEMSHTGELQKLLAAYSET